MQICLQRVQNSFLAWVQAAKQLAELSNTAIKQSVSTIQRLTADVSQGRNAAVDS